MIFHQVIRGMFKNKSAVCETMVTTETRKTKKLYNPAASRQIQSIHLHKMAARIWGECTNTVFTPSNENLGHPLGKWGVGINEENRGMKKPYGLSCASDINIL